MIAVQRRTEQEDDGEHVPEQGGPQLRCLCRFAPGSSRVSRLGRQRNPDAARIDQLSRWAEALAPSLADRSLSVAGYLMTEFADLHADPRAGELAAKADAFLADYAATQPRP